MSTITIIQWCDTTVNLDVVQEIELVDVSGTNVLLSPVFQQMLRAVESHEVYGIVVADQDRFIRADNLQSLAVLDILKSAKAAASGEPVWNDSGLIRLETPFSIPNNWYDLGPVPEGQKRCRICEKCKPLAEFTILKTKKGSWPYYACKDCTRQLQNDAYKCRKQRKMTSPNENQS